MENRVCVWSCRDHHMIWPKRQASLSKHLKIIDLLKAAAGLLSSRLSGNVTAIYCTLFRTIVEILLKAAAYATAVSLERMQFYAATLCAHSSQFTHSTTITSPRTRIYGEITVA